MNLDDGLYCSKFGHIGSTSGCLFQVVLESFMGLDIFGKILVCIRQFVELCCILPPRGDKSANIAEYGQ
jgi:hypothetical protein